MEHVARDVRVDHGELGCGDAGGNGNTNGAAYSNADSVVAGLTGVIDLSTVGSYAFQLWVNGWARMFIDGKLVVDWTWDTGAFQVAAGSFNDTDRGDQAVRDRVR